MTGQQVALHGKDNRLGGIDPIPPGRWKTPGTADPFLNGWTDVGGGAQTLRWRRTNENQTEIQGAVVGGTANPVINLPDPYRPAAIQTAVGVDGTGAIVVWTFEPSGDLSVDASAGGGASGAAGGVLDGTYPNPGIAASVAGSGLSESANVLAVNVDNSTVEISSDNIRVKASGITANEIAADSVGESEIILADVTTEDVSTSKHGFVPKAPADTSKFLRGDGTWAVVGGVTSAMASDVIWDAKGDLAAATGADAASKLTVGSNGKILVAASGESTGLKWETGYLGGLELVYRYTVTGSDKASIDTGADTADAGTNDWTNGDLLEVWLVARTDDAAATATIDFIVNNDTGANYDWMRVTGNTVTASANNSLAQTSWRVSVHGSGGSSSYPSSFHLTIPNYTGTTFNKIGEILEARNDATAGNNEINVRAFGYRSTSAITRLKVAAVSTAKLKVGSQLLIYKRRNA